jgi:hypothetical protein
VTSDQPKERQNIATLSDSPVSPFSTIRPARFMPAILIQKTTAETQRHLLFHHSTFTIQNSLFPPFLDSNFVIRHSIPHESFSCHAA